MYDRTRACSVEHGPLVVGDEAPAEAPDWAVLSPKDQKAGQFCRHVPVCSAERVRVFVCTVEAGDGAGAANPNSLPAPASASAASASASAAASAAPAPARAAAPKPKSKASNDHAPKKGKCCFIACVIQCSWAFTEQRPRSRRTQKAVGVLCLPALH